MFRLSAIQQAVGRRGETSWKGERGMEERKRRSRAHQSSHALVAPVSVFAGEVKSNSWRTRSGEPGNVFPELTCCFFNLNLMLWDQKRLKK